MLHDILRPIGRFLDSFRRTLELLSIIYPLEFFMRLRWRVDPRIYFRGLRIRNVLDGNLDKKDDAFFVFVLYTQTSIPLFTSNAIEAIAKSPHNLIVVSNAPLPPLLKAQVLENCHKLIERRNVGRDFGAYKDGAEYVLHHYPNASRLVLMNDSVFFLKRKLDKLITDLNGPHDFIGVTEVHQFHYHVQSFMLSFGRAVLESRAFVLFWKRYRPIGTRRWAIHRGEIRLTRRLTRAGFRPHILFQAAHLLPHLQRRPAREVIESTRLLPVEVRGDIYSNFLPVLGERSSPASMAMVEAISSGITRLHTGPGRLDAGKLLQLSSQASSTDQWSLGYFSNQIIQSISRHNQMHHGGMLFIKYLDLPLLKRDIFYRELYPLEEVHQFLSEIGESLRDEILSDLRRSGSGKHLRGLLRVMYRNGSL